MVIFLIKKKYRYGVMRGTDGHRAGWFVIRQRVTNILGIPFGKIQRISHLFRSKDAAMYFLDKGNIPQDQITL